MTAEFENLKKRLPELCRIAAPSKNEKPVRDYLYAFWTERKDRGLAWQEASHIPGGGNTANILMTLEGKKPPVLLCAHMDTVPVGDAAEIAVLESDGILRSDGKTVLGGDDRAGIALALEMIDVFLADAERQVSLEVLFTVQEELGCVGSRNTGFQLKSALGYSLDGETLPPSLILSSPRKERFECLVGGRTAHAALEAEQGRNAICRAAKLIAGLPQGRLDAETTANIGSIHGGGQTNVVPAEARFTGELRSFSEARFAVVKERINAACAELNREDGYASEICWEHQYDGYALSRDAEAVQRFLRACARTNITPSLLSSPGGGDANNLNAQGIGTVVFGIGMHEIHSPGEYLSLKEVFTAAGLLRSVLAG
jgi:tripeptide aminopeptidase